MFNNSSNQTNNVYMIFRPTLISTQFVFLPYTLKALICIIHFTKNALDLRIKDYKIFKGS